MAEPRRTFRVTSRLRSIGHALRGIGTMLVSQHNAWIHAAATVVVVALGLWLGLDRIEWSVILLAIVAVWLTEALNTAFEFLADVASPEWHPLVKKSKDVAAGAVLIAAVGSVIIGVLILGPHLLARLG